MCKVSIQSKGITLQAAKGILKYSKGKNNVRLWYPNEPNIVVSGFSDFDYVGCTLDRKSTTCNILAGYYLFKLI